MRNKLGFVVLSVALGSLLSACSSVPNAVNPISWYRDVTGASKNDNLGNGQNEQNLEEGGNEPYPNLGSVPNPPDTQLSGVDRDKLVNSLVADRRNAQYSADNLRAGETASTVPPPAPPAAAPANSNSASSATIGGASPSAPAPSSAPTAPAASAPATPAAPSSPPATASASPQSPAPPAPSASTKSAATPPASGSNGATKTASNGGVPSSSSSKKPPPRGSEAPPPESSLQSPTIPNVPQGEAATPAPPLPNIPPPNASAASTPSAAAPGPSAAAPKLAKPASPPAPTQQATAPADVPPATALHRPAISYRVADVSFARGSASITDGTRNTIAEIVKLHSEDGGTIRIVGHGEATGKDAAMAGFTLALDRAQAVAVALADAGVDAKDIAVEAAPVPVKGGADAPRAEVYLEQ